jgi:TRAP-type C4-dicarboxylate transport system permease small subunit
MTNDRYLIVSYFLCAALSIALGLLGYYYLRRPFAGVAEAAPGRGLPSMLKRLFPCGFVLPALLGFVSVSYRSCDRTTYTEIVASRGYLVEKNQEQISSILLYLLFAVVFWNLVALFVLRFARDGGEGHKTGQRTE